MSGSVLIYNAAGTTASCSSATYNQIKELIDDRKYKVDYFSQAPASNDRFNPVPLLVFPGGNYREMQEELKPLAPRIREMVIKEGTSLLGICAGAIATGTSFLDYDNKLKPHTYNSLQPMVISEFVKPDHLHLQLYPEDSSYFYTEEGGFYGTQEVRKVTDLSSPYSLYFQSGVFFTPPEHPDSRSLLEYSSFTFSGYYQKKDGTNQHYQNITPCAAVTHKVGKGTLVLSGVHPEISAKVVETFPTRTPAQEKAKKETIEKLNQSPKKQAETMRDFLDVLSIVTKKV